MGLSSNIKKTKLTTAGMAIGLRTDNENTEMVDSFCHLRIDYRHRKYAVD